LSLTGFLDFEYVTAFIVATLGAGAMWKLAFMAVRTFGETNRNQRIVRAALGGAGLGMAPLWVRHF
jgi:hypothetical protein